MTYHPAQPTNTWDSYEEWFDSTNCWEYPWVSRPEYDITTSPLCAWYKGQRVLHFLYHLERLVMFRALPGFKKEVDGRSRMWVDALSPDEWDYVVSYLSNAVPPSKSGTRRVPYPDHGFKRKEEQDHITWLDKLPPLAHTFWWWKKWVDPFTYHQYRACVNSLKLVYNNWTRLVRVEFTYDTWVWHDNVQTWCYV